VHVHGLPGEVGGHSVLSMRIGILLLEIIRK
jgi:hypothetical protein